MAEYPEGTTVCLKTGGPMMTVEDIRGGHPDGVVAVVWMVEGVVHRDVFHTNHLNAFVDRRQMPVGMEHCKLQILECPKGHTRLTATNWVDHGCPQCQIERLVCEATKGALNGTVLQDDLRDMCRALGLPDGARPESPHEVFRECIAKVGSLRAALKPFADYAAHVAEHHPGWDHDKFSFPESMDTKLGMKDFRTARAVLDPGIDYARAIAAAGKVKGENR